MDIAKSIVFRAVFALLPAIYLCKESRKACAHGDDEDKCSLTGPSYIQKSIEGRLIANNTDGDLDVGTHVLSAGGRICTCVESDRVQKFIAGVPVFNYPKRGTSDDQASLLQSEKEVNQWIVMLSDKSKDEDLSTLCSSTTGSAKCISKGHPSEGGIPFVLVEASEADLATMLSEKGVTADFIEADTEIEEEPEHEYLEVSSWGLDRIDARSGLDGKFSGAADGGAGVHVYVADGGIRTTHNEFEGRATHTLEALWPTFKVCTEGDSNCAVDRRGHGTHVAGVVGGKTYGVAPGVSLHAVKILNDQGTGFISNLLEAADWIAENAQHPAVFSASLGGPDKHPSVVAAIDAMVRAKVTVVVSAGNKGGKACDQSPAYVPSAITVGAMLKDDSLPGWANKGSCVDIWAPGAAIISAGVSSDEADTTKSGSSFAVPHVAGAAALLLKEEPDLSPAEVTEKLLSTATKDAITNIVDDSPNLLLYVGPDDSGATPVPPVPPSPAPVDNSIDTDFETSPTPTGTTELPCESFCRGECPCLKDWSERCDLRSCSGCDECISGESS